MKYRLLLKTREECLNMKRLENFFYIDSHLFITGS